MHTMLVGLRVRRAAPSSVRQRSGPHAAHARIARLRRPAASSDDDPSTAPSGGDADKEANVEAMEARLGLGRKARSAGGGLGSPSESARRASGETIRNDKAQWKEGQLLPDGWDKMDPGERVMEVLYGERGFLFWLNWLAYRSIFVLVGAWIVFRFIGPALNLYSLKDALLDPNLPLR